MQRRCEGRDIESHVTAVDDRDARLWFLESIDRVSRSLQGTKDCDETLKAALHVAMAILRVDRIGMLHACDPDALSWSVLEVHAASGIDGALGGGPPRDMDAETASLFRTLRDSSGPVYLDAAVAPLPATAALFGARSVMATSVRPIGDTIYVLAAGTDHSRAFTPREEMLLGEIAQRLASTLSSLRELRRLSERATRLAEAERIAHIGFWENDVVADRITWSDEAYRILGLVPNETFPNAVEMRQRIHPDDREKHAAASARAMRGESRYEIQYRVVRPSGEVRNIYSVGDIVRDADGRVLRGVGLVQDITERKQTEEKLALFRSLLDHTNDAIEVIDPATGAFLDVNERACAAHGYTREEYLQLRVWDMGPLLVEAQWQTTRERISHDGGALFESEHRRKDGTVFPVEVNVTAVQLEREYFLAVVRDITERKRANRALVESHSLLTAIVEGTADAVSVKDTEGRYLMMNAAGARMTGRTVPEVIGSRDVDLFPAEAAEAIMQRDRDVMASGISQTSELKIKLDGVKRTLISTRSVYRDAEGNAVGLVATGTDVTDLKRMEDELRQAQKMEAVGRLASGVAHDFNNMLTVIDADTQMLLDRLEPGDPNRELVDEIREASQRGGGLTSQLLAFTRKQILQSRQVDLGALLRNLLQLLRRVIGEDVTIELTQAPDLGPINVDPGQLEQAIVNLAVNARDAMPGGGRLTIEARNVDLDAARAAQLELAPGRYVVLLMTDTGAGMDEATLARAFEPFFTTKPLGRGTGLGLAMVYGFVRQSGGHVAVESEVGNGTQLAIHLPHAATKALEAQPTPAPPEDDALVFGTETVLLVEDEDAVRNVSKRVLQSRGYNVLDARDGRDALSFSRQYSGPIHLLVTDVVMPRMGGRELADALSRERPSIRVLFVSGYPEQATLHVQRDGAAHTSPFLPKPFTQVELARKIRGTLDAAAAP
jgi:two-component system cell cycle sensor histidine kinase/response regulator CckA